MRLIDANALEETFEIGRACDRCKIRRENCEHESLSIIEICGTIAYAPTVDAVPVVRCKDCRYFELNHTERINGIPLILAHQICTRWGNGCKTDENGFCFMGEKVTE